MLELHASAVVVLAAALSLAVERVLARRAGRWRLRRAWAAIHAGDVERGRRMLQPFLDSALPRRREPARIALLAAARVSGDDADMRALLQSIDRATLSAENRRVLQEEEVRVLVELGETAQAVRAAEALLDEGGAVPRRRALELHAYALLADGRHQAAERALLNLRAASRGPRAAPQRAWASYQLGLLRRLERREGEARQLLLEAASEGRGAPAARLAEQALREGETPGRL